MKQLVICCEHGGSKNGADIYASLPLDEEPTVNTVYAVPQYLSPSGTAELLEYDLTEARYPYWSLFLKSVPKPPEDPCDSDFMEEISS